MANVLSVDYIKTNAFALLPIEDEALYDTQIEILINAAISKLKNEGLDINAVDKNGDYLFAEGSPLGYDYIMCVAYQIMKDIDYDADMSFLTEQYITRVNTIRCSLTRLQK